ncbi:MAG: lipopolysaccharide biosynthesis protein [Ignavibacteriaceae bacterium]
MQNLILKLKNLFRFEGSSRSGKAKKNIIILFFLNGFNFLATFLLVPLTIKYLGQTEYGLWLTLSSILMFLGYMDFGIGNGLRNKLAEALAKDQKGMAKTYVSTAYATFGAGIILLWLIFLAVFGFINWQKILNAPGYLTGEVNKLIFWVFIFFLLQFLFKLLTSIINADQKPAVNGLLSVLSNSLTLLLVFILYITTKGNLFYLGFGSSIIPILVFLVASLFLFSKSYRSFSPSFNAVNIKYSRDLFSLGMQFFIIQVAGLILFATDNIIITQLFGPKEVTTYNIAFKYFNYITLIFNIILAPFWSGYTEAFVKDEIAWIKKVTNKILKIWVLLSSLVVIMIITSNFVYKIWVGSEIKVPFLLSIVMGLFVVLANWNNIFAYFINGVGKIRLQFYNAIFVAVINIPLSIFFAKHLNMGISGVMAATCVCVFIGSIWAPIQYKKIINKTAKGIWAK